MRMSNNYAGHYGGHGSMADLRYRLSAGLTSRGKMLRDHSWIDWFDTQGFYLNRLLERRLSMKPEPKPDIAGLSQVFTGLLMLTLLSACGGGATSPSVTKVGGASPAISVSLDDAWTAVTPNGSEKVQLTDERHYTAPNVINAVGGAYAGGNPAQFLHGRINFGGNVCTYQSTGSNDTVLTLIGCNSAVTGSLSANSIIELENYDAPGYLLEANFSLTK